MLQASSILSVFESDVRFYKYKIVKRQQLDKFMKNFCQQQPSTKATPLAREALELHLTGEWEMILEKPHLHFSSFYKLP